MRDLTFLDTCYLGALLVCSLILPVMLSVRLLRNPALRRPGAGMVWLSQAWLGLAGVVVLASGEAAPWAVVFGAAGCGACVAVVHGRLREIDGSRSRRCAGSVPEDEEG